MKDMNQIILESENWAEQKLNEVFEVDKFKAINKENNYIFQALSFMSEASQKLSIANTILKRDKTIVKNTDVINQLSELQNALHDLKDYTRKFK